MIVRAPQARAIALSAILLPVVFTFVLGTASAAPLAHGASVASASRAPVANGPRIEGVTGAVGAWQAMPPPALSQTASVYDVAHQRLLIFGGEDNVNLSNDLWSLSLTGPALWSRVDVTGTLPSKRSACSLIYDPIRNRLVLFGGRDSTDTTLGDVWTLPLGVAPVSWNLESPTGSPPMARAYASMVYDSLADRAVVFGGAAAVTDSGPPAGFLNDVWALSLSGTPAWTQIIPTAPNGGVPSVPLPRCATGAIYDGPRTRMLVVGGFDGSALSEVWELTLGLSSHWTILTPTGGPPPPRAGTAAILDPPNDRMVLYGGLGGPDVDQDFSDAWSLDLASTTWTELSPTGTMPTPRDFPNGVYDLGSRRLVFYSARDSVGGTVADAVGALNLDGAPAWSVLGPAPPNRAHGASAYDPVGGRLLLFGGYNGAAELGDTWQFSLSTMNWSQLGFGGSTPGARTGHTVIYDVTRNRLVLYGGHQGVAAYGDVWELTLGGTPAWNPLSPSGTPPADRTNHTAVYDSRHDRMIVYGGQTPGGAPFADAWAFDLATSTWSLLDDGTSGPSARAQHTAVYDDAQDRMVVFSGFGQNADLWALSLSGSPTWSPLFPGGLPPDARYGCAAGYDTTTDAMVLFGGASTGGGDNNDAWVLSLRGSTSWEIVDEGDPIPRDREAPAYGYDQASGSLFVFGGNRNLDAYESDTWVFTPDRTTPVLGSLVRASARNDRVELSWSLPEPVRVRIERREPATDWTLVGTRVAAGGRLDFVDAAVASGHRYGYRLVGPNGAVLVTETWVDVPHAAAIQLAGFVPNPARDVANVSFTLADASPARLEIFDLGGRRVFAREVGSLGAGRHVVPIASAGLRAGVYQVRLVPRIGATLERRAVLIR